MAKKSKFLMVSLDDEKAQALANVLSNKTCRKILEHLADKKDTETGISKALGIAISTVHYNLLQLVKGGLIEAEEFHYSKKGKVVNHYSLANQYILIAPKNSFGLKEKLKNLLAVVPIAGAVGYALSTFNSTPAYPSSFAMEAAPMMARTAEDAGASAMMLKTSSTIAAPTFRDQAMSLFSGMDIGLLFVLGALFALCTYLLLAYLLFLYRQK